MSRAREGTVRNLQELYTVAVGVAVALAVDQLIGAGQEPPIHWNHIPVFAAFLATLIPFYHGAMRHLDDVYIQEGGRHVRSGALLADFLLLFLEACLFFIAARLISDARATAWALATLLALDAAWGTVVYLVFATRGRRWAEIRWVLVNSVAVPTLAIGLFLTAGMKEAEEAAVIVLLIVAVIRTITDYWLSWDFYFPR
jgi:hypothetical protein